MARQTSFWAYHKIKSDGLLSQRRWEVYRLVFEHGPLTSAEAFKILNESSPVKNITQSRARFTELRNMGVFYETGTRICKVTGMTVIEWDVTDRIPVKFEKPKRTTCPHCKGRGYFQAAQGKLNL